jgi:hypothetical protein
MSIAGGLSMAKKRACTTSSTGHHPQGVPTVYGSSIDSVLPAADEGWRTVPGPQARRADVDLKPRRRCGRLRDEHQILARFKGLIVQRR